MVRTNAFHRLLRLAVLAGAALIVALPLLVGPAMPVVVAMIAEKAIEHRCACGMKAGKCGCPECEADLRPELAAPASAVLHSSCDDNRFVRGTFEPMIFTMSTLAPAVPILRLDRVCAEERPPPNEQPEPMTPPPRSRSRAV